MTFWQNKDCKWFTGMSRYNLWLSTTCMHVLHETRRWFITGAYTSLTKIPQTCVQNVWVFFACFMCNMPCINQCNDERGSYLKWGELFLLLFFFNLSYLTGIENVFFDGILAPPIQQFSLSLSLSLSLSSQALHKVYERLTRWEMLNSFRLEYVSHEKYTLHRYLETNRLKDT